MGRDEQAEFVGQDGGEEQYCGAGDEARDGVAGWGCGVSF